MANILVDLGEEFVLETALQGQAVDIGLYNDSTDSISDTEDVSDITTEPSGGSYARQSVSLNLADVSGDWQAHINADAVFDTSDSSQTVDSYFIVSSFQADDTGDGGSTLHLIATGALSQSYDLSNVDQLTVNSGTAAISIT